MAATTSFDNGTITFQQAVVIAAAMGATVGRLAGQGKNDSLKGNTEFQMTLEMIMAMLLQLSTGDEADYDVLIQSYNTHGIINYVGAQVGATPGTDTELMFVKPDEVKH